jgi:hypothetical protein
VIESLPIVGTTWYTGGPAYWLRRAGLSLLFLALVAFLAWLIGIALLVIVAGSAGHAPDVVPGFIAGGIVVAVNIAGFVYFLRLPNRKPPDPRQSEREFKEAAVFITGWTVLRWVVLILIVVGLIAGGAAGRSLAGVATAIAGLVVFGGAACLLGPMLALFIMSLMEPKTVRLARQDVDDWYREHGHDSPEPVRPA